MRIRSDETIEIDQNQAQLLDSLRSQLFLFRTQGKTGIEIVGEIATIEQRISAWMTTVGMREAFKMHWLPDDHATESIQRYRSELPKEWIIQRCTQRWKGTELIYDDWKDFCALHGIAADSRDFALMTHDEMVEGLDRCNAQWPYEFRGHNAVNCRCPEHAHFKTGGAR
jgi:hypothetical protein